jgi:hypothetical protein
MAEWQIPLYVLDYIQRGVWGFSKGCGQDFRSARRASKLTLCKFNTNGTEFSSLFRI